LKLVVASPLVRLVDPRRKGHVRRRVAARKRVASAAPSRDAPGLGILPDPARRLRPPYFWWHNRLSDHRWIAARLSPSNPTLAEASRNASISNKLNFSLPITMIICP
jgi:hypothetical protein